MNKLIGAATFLKDSGETPIIFQTKGITEIKVWKGKGLDKNIIYTPNLQSFPLLQLDKKYFITT